jgi:hypothetical protein
LFLITAELDPGIKASPSAIDRALHDDLCKQGQDRCPAMLFAKGASHMGEVFAIDTADRSISDPILAWIRKLK